MKSGNREKWHGWRQKKSHQTNGPRLDTDLRVKEVAVPRIMHLCLVGCYFHSNDDVKVFV